MLYIKSHDNNKEMRDMRMAEKMYDMKPIDYAVEGCRTVMEKYPATDLPPKGRFHYHQGVFLSGVLACFNITHNDEYFKYIKTWLDSLTDENGNIKHREETELDDLQPGILFFSMIEHSFEKKYKIALDHLMKSFETWKTTDEGGLWHKDVYPNQMWLDGLYMASQMRMMYAKKYNIPKIYDDVAEQALLMYEKTKDTKTGLVHHAYDSSRKAPWANPITGQSPTFWGRSIGWFIVALLEILEYLPKTHKDYTALKDIFVKTSQAVMHYQDDNDGMWYQVISEPYKTGNWKETSCSALFAYAIARGVKKGYLPSKYIESAYKGYSGVTSGITFDKAGYLEMSNICVGTGVGDFDYYVGRNTSKNDLHGIGAFILMCCEIEEFERKSEKD